MCKRCSPEQLVQFMIKEFSSSVKSYVKYDYNHIKCIITQYKMIAQELSFRSDELDLESNLVGSLCFPWNKSKISLVWRLLVMESGWHLWRTFGLLNGLHCCCCCWCWFAWCCCQTAWMLPGLSSLGHSRPCCSPTRLLKSLVHIIIDNDLSTTCSRSAPKITH